jgi:hypothetical protein
MYIKLLFFALANDNKAATDSVVYLHKARGLHAIQPVIGKFVDHTITQLINSTEE